MSDRLEDIRGVHLLINEHTICGDAFDAPDTESNWEFGPFKETKKHVVTCIDCIRVIRICKATIHRESRYDCH